MAEGGPSGGQDLAPWLRGLGFERYLESFRAHDIDLRALPFLTDADLQEVGVSLGHRRIMLAAIATLSARPASPAGPELLPAASPLLARSNIAQTAPEQAERRLVSVLFCDMVGSTELARRTDPEDLRQILRTYQDEIATVVASYGGHLAQYLGDGVMAYFGWPTAYEDQAERAVRAGLEIIARLKGFQAGSAGPIRSRIAVASGEVVVGDLSSAGRQEGAIAGATPNLAARLQQCAEPDQLVISEETRRLIGAAFEITACDSRLIKGFDSAVQMHRVDRVRDGASRFDVLRGQSLSRFVGRKSEQALVLEKWEVAKAGDGQVVLVSGEAGIGKSRFVRAIADALGGEPHTRWQVQCSPYHTSSTLYPVIQGLGRILELQPGDALERRRAKLASFLGETSREPGVLPVFAELLSIGSATDESLQRLSPQERMSLTLSSLVERVLAIAQAAPLLLVIEDAHWIDPTTLDLLERLVARLSSARILMLVPHRPEWGADWPSRYGHVTSFTLGRLSRPQATELVRDLMGPDVADELIGEIAERTDGVPMFVEEVARSLVESSPASAGSFLVPATLQGALVARLDALRPTCREVVQAGAVMGREFHTDVVARVCGKTRQETDAVLEDLARARLIVRSTVVQTVAFRHALIQDVAYQSLLRSKRRQIHKAVAEALIDIRPETTEAHPEILAHHLTEAGATGPARAHWQRAGMRALGRYANDEAVRHHEKALEVSRQELPADRERAMLEASILLGHAKRAASQLPSAISTYQEAAGLARSLGDDAALAEIALGCATAEFSASQVTTTSRNLLQEALSRLGESPDSEDRCMLMNALARAHLMSGEHECADELGRRAAAMARRLGDPHALAEVLIRGMLVPRAGYDPGGLAEFEAPLEELLSASQRVDDYDLRGRAFATCFYRWMEIGRRDRMDAIFERWSAWGNERKYTVVQWVNRHVQAILATLDGDLGAAEAFAEQAVALGRGSQRDQAEGVYGMQMFTIRREQARLKEVAPFVKRLLDDERTRAAWQPGFALIACELGYREAARRSLTELAGNGFDLPRDAKYSATLAYLAEVCAAVGDKAVAQTLYGLLEPYANMTITAGVATMCYGSAHRHLGLLAELLEEWQQAEEHFEAALVLNEQLRAPLWLAHTQADLGALLQRRGKLADIRRSAALREAARSTASSLGLAALTRRLQRSQN